MLRAVTLSVGAFAIALTAAGTTAAVHAEAGPLRAVTPVAKTVIQIYKSPTCGCCSKWVDHIKASGFVAEVHDVPESDLQARKARLGVGPRLASCHTAIVNGYVVEGHVPAADIQRLLREKPAVAGIAAPGMPVGSPGMEMPGGQKDAYDVLAFTKSGTTRVFARH